jgi:hypothetical protein
MTWQVMTFPDDSGETAVFDLDFVFHSAFPAESKAHCGTFDIHMTVTESG